MDQITFEIEQVVHSKSGARLCYSVYSNNVPVEKLAAHYAVSPEFPVAGVGETILAAIENYIELLYKAGIEL